MSIPDRFLEELTERCDMIQIVSAYTALKKSGSSYSGLCPFHTEKTPSFHVDAEKHLYHCFGCGAGGGVIQFMMQAENLPFVEAVEKLAGMVGMTVPTDEADKAAKRKRERMKLLNRDAARFFFKTLNSPAGAEGLAYLRGRGLSDGIIRRFGLGFAPNSWDALMTEMMRAGYDKMEMLDAGLLVSNEKGRVYDRFRNRVMFPIISLMGDVIGFGGRVMDDSKPKYLNSSETMLFSKGHNLFAMNLAKSEKAQQFILAEGYMDVIALHQAGFRTAVASLGTALTTDQARLIKKYTDNVVIVYDADEAGQKATARAIEILKPAGLNVRILRIPDGKDPDEFIRKNGPEAFEHLLMGTQGDMDYRLSKLPGADDLKDDNKKIAYLKAAASLLATVKDPIERDVYTMRVAQQAGTTADAMRLQVKRELGQNTRREHREETRKVLDTRRMVQPKARELRYENPRAARAEEEIIAALFYDASLVRDIDVPAVQEQFTVPLYRKLLVLISEKVRDGGKVSLDVFSGYLDANESAQVARILNSKMVSGAKKAVEDSLDILKQESESTKESSLQALIDAKKGLEGF